MSENEEIDVGGSEEAQTTQVEVVTHLGPSVLEGLNGSDNESEEVETVSLAKSPNRDEGKLSMELPDPSEGGLADASRPKGGWQ
jgi:hypothetical protein